MKTAQQWQDELAGETSLQAISNIQTDALVHAALLAKKALEKEGHAYEGGIALRAILDDLSGK